MSRKLKGENGFALLELMIAIAVIAVGLLAMLHANTSSRQMGEGMNERTVALEDAQRLVELMRNTSATGAFPANVTAAYPSGAAVAGFNNLTNEQVGVSYANTTADPLDITVTVGWRARGIRNVSTELRTLMTKRE